MEKINLRAGSNGLAPSYWIYNVQAPGHSFFSQRKMGGTLSDRERNCGLSSYLMTMFALRLIVRGLLYLSANSEVAS